MDAAKARPPRHARVRSWRDVRSWPDTATRSWRRSLRFRTLVVTLGLTAFAVVVSCVWLALAVQDDLFASRRYQATLDAQRATQTAQATLDAAGGQSDSIQLRNLMTSVGQILLRQAGTDQIMVLRADAAPSPIAPQGFTAGGLVDTDVSDELRMRVEDNPDTQWWQSTELTVDGESVPGVLVGQQLDVAGLPYEVYYAYDLVAAQQTLGFVQSTLWVVGIVLVVLIGAILWFVLRSVTIPIQDAADTSAQLAAGDLEVRLDIRGEDELATLAASFNAMADSIQSQIGELADLSLVQQRFVSDVSHELRTPLTTIRLAADVLNDRKSDFDAGTARAAELLHAQVERFEVLLGDLLEISRYDAGSVELETEPTSLAHLAEDVMASMQQLAEQHGSDMRLVAPGGYSPVEMDPRRVRRIVRNLLGNAIEHGEGRPIVVTVDSNQNAVAVGVRDYGMGMSPGDTERVFDRFWRADPSRKRTIGGTGLGLSIAWGDARLHGGALSVWSRPGRGTNFVLTLPRHSGELSGPAPVVVEPVDEGDTLEDLGRTQPIDLTPGRDS